MTTPDVRKIAEQAVHTARLHRNGDRCLHGPFENDTFLAAAVLSAVEPVIRRQVAEEIAEKIDGQDDYGYGMYRSAYDSSAAIARSHAQNTETADGS